MRAIIGVAQIVKSGGSKALFSSTMTVRTRSGVTVHCALGPTRVAGAR